MIILTAHLGHISLKTINFSQREDNIRALIVKSPSTGKPLLYTRKNDGVRKSPFCHHHRKSYSGKNNLGAESGRNPREEENIYVNHKMALRMLLINYKSKNSKSTTVKPNKT